MLKVTKRYYKQMKNTSHFKRGVKEFDNFAVASVKIFALFYC